MLISNHRRGLSRNYSGPSSGCQTGSVAKRYLVSSPGVDQQIQAQVRCSFWPKHGGYSDDARGLSSTCVRSRSSAIHSRIHGCSTDSQSTIEDFHRVLSHPGALRSTGSYDECFDPTAINVGITERMVRTKTSLPISWDPIGYSQYGKHPTRAVYFHVLTYECFGTKHCVETSCKYHADKPRTNTGPNKHTQICTRIYT